LLEIRVALSVSRFFARVSTAGKILRFQWQAQTTDPRHRRKTCSSNPRKPAIRAISAPKHPHLYPEPRLAAGAKLLALRTATAAIDVSDGLSTDLAHLCEESGLAAEIDTAAIPVHALAEKVEKDGWIPSALYLALHGGEDYELLFTASPLTKVPAKIAGVPIRAVGRMKAHRKGKPFIEMIGADGKRTSLDAGGWEHFR